MWTHKCNSDELNRGRLTLSGTSVLGACLQIDHRQCKATNKGPRRGRQSLHPCTPMQKTRTRIWRGIVPRVYWLSFHATPWDAPTWGRMDRKPVIPMQHPSADEAKVFWLVGLCPQDGQQGASHRWTDTLGMPSSHGCRTAPAPGRSLSRADNPLAGQGELFWLSGYDRQQGTAQSHAMSMDLGAAPWEAAAPSCYDCAGFQVLVPSDPVGRDRRPMWPRATPTDHQDAAVGSPQGRGRSIQCSVDWTAAQDICTNAFRQVLCLAELVSIPSCRRS